MLLRGFEERNKSSPILRKPLFIRVCEVLERGSFEGARSSSYK